MQCDLARDLMFASLDGETAAELDSHLDVCPRCAEEWRDLRQVDAFLRAQPTLHPPPHFASRVMNRIDREVRQLLDWRHNLTQIGVVLTGTVLVAMTILLFVRGWRVTLAEIAPEVQVRFLVHAITVFAVALWETIGRGTLTRLFYLVTAATMAMIWFAALVVPRFARQPAANRP